jgi:hypothetical protein
MAACTSEVVPRVLSTFMLMIEIPRSIPAIGLRQPIEAFFGFNNNRLNLNQAKLAYELSMKQLKREELNLVYEISQDYFTLLLCQERMNIAG